MDIGKGTTIHKDNTRRLKLLNGMIYEARILPISEMRDIPRKNAIIPQTSATN